MRRTDSTPGGDVLCGTCFLERGLGGGEPGERDPEGRAGDVVESEAVAERDRARLAAVLAADAELELGAGVGLYGGLAQLAASSDRATLAGVRPLYELDQFIQTAFFWTALVIVVSLAVAGLRGVLPSWTTPVNAIIGVLFVLGGISVKASGAFAAGTGALVMIASLAFFVMIVEFGVLLWRPATATVPGGAPIIA